MMRDGYVIIEPVPKGNLRRRIPACRISQDDD
ncbi:hypothetical protein KYE_08518 [Marinobacter manganoxydans MnI7-9]|uniref:Uncharacterized protein n=1 Tax=Marinobacter manganoxydans MnI7-9 TaxID=1094979 RepID=G6YS69_9GAMM|nr:hypothetical protein KYE_08518 [Marinobacter manganoxydans MnI7-9]